MSLLMLFNRPNCTQETYNDAFFEALEGVTSALDNVHASESVITLYVHHRIPYGANV